MLININEEQNKKVEEFLDEEISNFKRNLISEKKIPGKSKKIQNYEINKKYNLISNNKDINNVKTNFKYEYITYNGQPTELINNTIDALNTGLHYIPKSKIKKDFSNVTSGNKKEINHNISKKAQNKFKTLKQRLSKNVLGKKINLKKKLINKEEKKINYIKNKKREKSLNINGKSIKTLSIKRNNEINYNSIIQNNSTNDNSIKISEKPNISSKNIIINNFNEKYNSNNKIKFGIIRKNKIYKKPTSKNKTKNYEMKEKYEKLDSECKDTKNKIDCLRCKNKNIEIRIDELKDKYDYIKKIRSDNDKNELNLNKLDNAYKYSENIKLKQIKLIQKIANEIQDLKIILNNN